MAHGKRPGPIGINSTDVIDSGTLARSRSSTPGPIGSKITSTQYANTNLTSREKIREYAIGQMELVKKKEKCSCHAMADIWGYAVQFYTGFWNNDEETYVEDVSYVLAGVNEWATSTDQTQVGQRVFDDSGFKEEFKDGSNQVQHFSAGVQSGYQWGELARYGHRIMRPDSDQDEALNDVSTTTGLRLDGIGLSLSEVKNRIENKVCTPKCGICNGGRGR